MGSGRAFQIGTILQEKEFLSTLFFANGTAIR